MTKLVIPNIYFFQFKHKLNSVALVLALLQYSRGWKIRYEPTQRFSLLPSLSLSSNYSTAFKRSYFGVIFLGEEKIIIKEGRNSVHPLQYKITRGPQLRFCFPHFYSMSSKSLQEEFSVNFYFWKEGKSGKKIGIFINAYFLRLIWLRLEEGKNMANSCSDFFPPSSWSEGFVKHLINLNRVEMLLILLLHSNG